MSFLRYHLSIEDFTFLVALVEQRAFNGETGLLQINLQHAGDHSCYEGQHQMPSQCLFGLNSKGQHIGVVLGDIKDLFNLSPDVISSSVCPSYR